MTAPAQASPSCSKPLWLRPQVWSDLVIATLGIFSASFGIKSFLLPSHIIDGGVTGISMLVAQLMGWPLPLLILVINVAFILLGLTMVGRRFALKSAMAIASFAVVLGLVSFPIVTADKVLTAVFGGFFIGGGIGLVIRTGAVMDGTEIVALVINRLFACIRVSDAILLFNIVIFSVAAFFLGVEPALYSILTYLSASKTIDFLIHGIEEYTAIVVISEQSDAIRNALTDDLNRSVTIYSGKRGLSGAEQDILYCVVTRLEIAGVKGRIHELDPNAFILLHALSDVDGGVVKRRRL